jgi:hypothetical protein
LPNSALNPPCNGKNAPAKNAITIQIIFPMLIYFEFDERFVLSFLLPQLYIQSFDNIVLCKHYF